jgi:hypothetical protein
MGEPERRRRRLRQPPPEPVAATPEVHDPVEEERPAAPRRQPPPADDREAERGLRGLVGSGASQVRVGAAMRARDASRPTPEDEAEAEARLVVVRRNWVPREDLPRGGGR